MKNPDMSEELRNESIENKHDAYAKCPVTMDATECVVSPLLLLVQAAVKGKKTDQG